MVEDAEGAAVATAAATAVAGTGNSSSSGGSSSSSSGGTAAAQQLFYVSQLLESRQREQARTQALARSVMVHNDQSFAVAAVFVPVYMM
jgi:nicotinamide mononucleotide (NMN) deamidase PncC